MVKPVMNTQQREAIERMRRTLQEEIIGLERKLDAKQKALLAGSMTFDLVKVKQYKAEIWDLQGLIKRKQREVERL